MFFWLLFGEFAIAMRERSGIPSVLQLLKLHHASDTTMSILVSALPALIGMLLGPIISYKSDRYRSRYGRRIPFMLVMTPIGAVAMIGLGFCPMLGAAANAALGASSPGLDFMVLTFFCLFWTVFECVAITTLGIYTGLVNDVVPQAVHGRFYAGFRIISLGAGVIFNYWIFQLTETHLFEIFVGIGLFFGLGGVLMCLMVKEGSYPPPEPVEEGGVGFMVQARAYFVECFAHPYFIWAFAAISCAAVAFSPFNTFAQWYAESIGMSKSELGKLAAMAYIVSMGLAFVIGMLVDRFSAPRVSLCTMVLYVLICLAGYFTVKDSATFAVFYGLHVITSGCYFTAAASLPLSLFPRLRFMQFNSAAWMTQMLVTIVVGLVQGPLLDYSRHQYGLTLLAGALFGSCAVFALAMALRKRAALPTGTLSHQAP